MVRHIFSIAEQAFGWNAAEQRLTVVQHWTGFSAGRHAFVIVTDGVVTTQRAGTAGQVKGYYDSAAYLVRPHTVTQERARDRLEELGLPRAHRCPQCGDRLPIGGLYCTGCGLPDPINHSPAVPAEPVPVPI